MDAESSFGVLGTMVKVQGSGAQGFKCGGGGGGVGLGRLEIPDLRAKPESVNHIRISLLQQGPDSVIFSCLPVWTGGLRIIQKPK